MVRVLQQQHRDVLDAHMAMFEALTDRLPIQIPAAKTD
jgi:hypothetical protein